jgi:hypothetical protein
MKEFHGVLMESKKTTNDSQERPRRTRYSISNREDVSIQEAIVGVGFTRVRPVPLPPPGDCLDRRKAIRKYAQVARYRDHREDRNDRCELSQIVVILGAAKIQPGLPVDLSRTGRAGEQDHPSPARLATGPCDRRAIRERIHVLPFSRGRASLPYPPAVKSTYLLQNRIPEGI